MKRTLYYGGSILTMDKEQKRAEALLCEGGLIAAVGRYEDMCDTDAERIDLRGRTLMPAFVDGHSHIVATGINVNENCSLDGCTGFDDMLDRLRRYREEKGLFNGECIRGRGYDLAIMKEGSIRRESFLILFPLTIP